MIKLRSVLTFPLTVSTVLCGSSKTFLIHFLGCINIKLVLCEILPAIRSSFLKSSLPPIINDPDLSSAISAGNTGYLSTATSPATLPKTHANIMHY